MSFKDYVTWWIKAKENLDALKTEDDKIEKKYTPTSDRVLANKLVGGLYTKYCMLVQDLDSCLDQLAQPQKTFTIRKLIDSAATRLKELNKELQWIDFSEYHYVDDSLIEQKLIPHDIEILHPYLSYPRPWEIQEMWKKLKSGEKIFEKPVNINDTEDETSNLKVLMVSDKDEGLLEEQKKKTIKKVKIVTVIEDPKQLTSEEVEKKKEKAKLDDLILLIQNHERARQDRLYHFDKNAMRLRQLIPQKQLQLFEGPDSNRIRNAAITIQRIMRGYFTRKNLKRREDERRILIRMTEPSYRSKEPFEIFEKHVEERRELRELRIYEYLQAHINENDRILRVVGPGLVEDIGDEILEWFAQWYLRARMFDKFPVEEKGGTILVVRGETMTPEEWIEEVEKRRRQKVKKGGAAAAKAKEAAAKAKEKNDLKERKKKEKEAIKKAAKAKKKRRENVAVYQLELDEALSKNRYAEGTQEYDELWKHRDEMLNPEERHYMDLITNEKCHTVQLEMRAKVDEMMRIELELLEDALETDRTRGKKGKKKKKKKPKKKKKKGKRGKKKPKDLTAHRAVEDLFQELYDNNIIRTYPKTSLEEFRGDFSFKNWDLRFQKYNPPATMGDVRQAITVNCIIPLGVETTTRPKGVLIGGPPKTGKTLLANAIFTATRCVLFDLSPENLYEKYPGKEGLIMLVHLINKMSRILQPSILFFENAEKTFYKKVPKDEKYLDPKRLAKMLQKKIIKPITPDDRVMLLGITDCPWAAQKAKINKAYDKAILLPKPDYGSVYLYWREFLMAYHWISRDFEFSSLARLTSRYTYYEIKETVKNVLTSSRIALLKYKPITHEELYEPFLAMEPTSEKIYKKFTKWYNKTPIGKLAFQFEKVSVALREVEAREKEKKEKKKNK